MKTKKQNLKSGVVGALVALGMIQTASAAVVVTLPTTLIDNIGPQQYDQGTVFSASLLEQQRSAGLMPGNPTTNFTPATGSGTAGVLVYSGNNVQTTNTAYGFSKSIDAVNADVDATWAGGTVGGLRNYLNSLTSVAGSLQPLFVFDHNENQQSPDLRISAKVTVGNSIFSFDTDANGAFDATSYVYSCGIVNIGPSATDAPPCSINYSTTSGTTYKWNANGQGQPDYYTIIQALNIWSDAYSATDIFNVEIHMRDNEHSFEELAIGGFNFFRPTNDVPEPGSLALLGLSLGGLAALSRRRAVKKAN